MDEELRLPPKRSPFEAVLETLEDFESVVVSGTGAVLYAKRWEITELPRNLHAASAAAGLGLSSLDHAKRLYAPPEVTESDPALDAYMNAYRAAKKHIRSARSNVRTVTSDRVHLGRLTAAVALQRLESGFFSMHLLYRLGLNVEGDAIARQVLEQIAWAMAVRELVSLDDIRNVQPQRSIGELRKVLPHMGRLYGALNNLAHAGLAEHRASVVRSVDGSTKVVFANGRLADSAWLLLTLADAWAIACEASQGELREPARSLLPTGLPDPDRAFLAELSQLVACVEEHDETAGATS